MNHFSRPKKVAWWLVFILFLAAAVGLERYYLTYSEDYIEVIKRARTNLYAKFHSGWILPDVTDMKNQLRTDKWDPFDLMILQTALGRHRMSKVAPHAYPRLLESYRSGWWNDSFVSDMTPLMHEMDRLWIDARRAALADDTTSTEAKLETVPDNGMKIIFPAGTTTADIGSGMEVLFTLTPGTRAGDYAYAQWGTSKNPADEVYRYRTCTVERTTQTAAGKILYRLELDMSDSAQWTYPETEPVWMHFHKGPGSGWLPHKFTGLDSPLLPVD